LEVSPRVPVYRRVEKTAPFPRECSSIPLVEVVMLSTSPKLDKSLVNCATRRLFQSRLVV
jgi:hypothetical protein